MFLSIRSVTVQDLEKVMTIIVFCMVVKFYSYCVSTGSNIMLLLCQMRLDQKTSPNVLLFQMRSQHHDRATFDYQA